MHIIEWETNGYQEQVTELFLDWVKKQNVPGLSAQIVKLPHRTPLIFLELDPSNKNIENAPTILLYAHYDKQPPLTNSDGSGWSEGLGPYKPVIKEGPYGGLWLYGRGGADDGYGLPASLTAILALKDQNIDHGRIVVLIEGCEESGSKDLPYYIDHLKEKIGTPDLVVCLDSGAGNYDTMWMTTSLRGVMSFPLKVSLLDEGIHSGTGSGIVASSFRVVRQLLSRIEDENTGVVVDDFQVEIPQDRITQAKHCAEILGQDYFNKFPIREGVQTVSENLSELILNGTWKATVCVTGVNGIPPIERAGNVLREFTEVKVSMRLPPSLDTKHAEKRVREILTTNPPYNAKVEIPEHIHIGSGWAALPAQEWTVKAFENASKEYYGQVPQFFGEGGTIPFIGLLQSKFPKTQFCVTGILGPESNAHSIDEGFPIEYAKKLTCCIASIISDHYKSCTS